MGLSVSEVIFTPFITQADDQTKVPCFWLVFCLFFFLKGLLARSCRSSRFRFLGADTILHGIFNAHHETGQEHFLGTSNHLIQRTVLQGLHDDGRGCPAGSELRICDHVEDIVGIRF